jgi:hypothetical protein
MLTTGFNRQFEPRGTAVSPPVAQGVAVSDPPFGDQNDILAVLSRSPGKEPFGVAKIISLDRIKAIDAEVQGT